MISQDVSVKVNSMIAMFSDGDICVSTMRTENNNVAVAFSNIGKGHNIGDNVTTEDMKKSSTPLIMVFNNSDSLNVVKEIFERASDLMQQKEEEEKATNFVVPYKNIYVTSAFRNTNPSPEKIMRSQSFYAENKKLDREIVVKESLTLEDGYVGYLVAGFNNLNYVEVTAPNGIKTKVGNNVVVFRNNKVFLDYVAKEDGNDFVLKVCNSGKIYNVTVKDICEAVEHIKKLSSVFIPEIKFISKSTLNSSVMQMLAKENINSSFK